MFCDLHNHSSCSDGTLTPSELAATAAEAGLGAVALTDHNTVSGLHEFVRSARELGVEPVPGVEISTEYPVDGEVHEFHVLALFLGEASAEQVETMLREARRCSDVSKRELVDRLRAGGYDIPTYDEIRAEAGGVSINRAHVAAHLVRLGYAADRKEVFDTILDENSGYYRPARRLDSLEVISAIRHMGAVSVLAHPLLHLEAHRLEGFLEKASAAGLDAMEVYYSEYDERQTEQALALAGRYGLACSGGSDFHGGNKPHITIGAGKGDLAVPYEWYERLKAIHDSRTSK
ncbi:MAG: PHP domain-containing protein [Ruminococcaceae bacterium]|nr:PHP domain-containing protein [Oscillospiraceae bacterium]